jgi:hypothetical protein
VGVESGQVGTTLIFLICTRGADKSLARCILFDGESISFDASLVFIYIYINKTIYIYIILIFLQL